MTLDHPGRFLSWSIISTTVLHIGSICTVSCLSVDATLEEITRFAVFNKHSKSITVKEFVWSELYSLNTIKTFPPLLIHTYIAPHTNHLVKANLLLKLLGMDKSLPWLYWTSRLYFQGIRVLFIVVQWTCLTQKPLKRKKTTPCWLFSFDMFKHSVLTHLDALTIAPDALSYSLLLYTHWMWCDLSNRRTFFSKQ